MASRAISSQSAIAAVFRDCRNPSCCTTAGVGPCWCRGSRRRNQELHIFEFSCAPRRRADVRSRANRHAKGFRAPVKETSGGGPIRAKVMRPVFAPHVPPGWRPIAHPDRAAARGALNLQQPGHREDAREACVRVSQYVCRSGHRAAAGVRRSDDRQAPPTRQTASGRGMSPSCQLERLRAARPGCSPGPALDAHRSTRTGWRGH